MEEKKEKFNKVEYDNRYIKENKDRVNVVRPKGRKNDIKAYAQSAGISATEWINQAILEKMQRQDGAVGEPVTREAFSE